MEVNIRHASREDAQAIAEIYNHAIDDRNATFDSFPVSADRYTSFFDRNERASMLVAVANDQVIGWASVSPISNRWAYRFTCIGSFFVHKEFRGKKIGSALKAAQINEAARIGYHSLVVEVLSTNVVSILLNLRFGFRVVGETWEAGYRDGKWIGLVIMQKILKGEIMRDRQVRFSIITDDIEKSISLYRDALGLDMRPICNAIAMFPLGVAEFEVCHREASKQLLDFKLDGELASGLLISLSLGSEEQVDKAVKAALQYGATSVNNESNSNSRILKDFNGVIWSLTIA